MLFTLLVHPRSTHYSNHFLVEWDTFNYDLVMSDISLLLSAEIVNLMGGKLIVDSEKSKGSQFIFTLTFNKGSEQDLPSTEAINKI